ncbi:Aldose reductase [Entamoeba marina]
MNTNQPILSFRLNNGRHIPAIGFGTWMLDKQQIGPTVVAAIKNGYRHIDTAATSNEAEMGEAIDALFKEGNILREEVFINTKLASNRKNDVEAACKESLKRLHLDYLDCYVIQNFVTFKKDVGFPSKKDDFDEVPIETTWRQMEKLVEDGLVKTIGVSNFPVSKLKELLAIAKIKPAVNQVEFNVYFQQQDLAPFCKENGIRLVAYSPLCNNGYEQRTPLPNVFEDKKLIEIANKHHRTVAQVILRFIVQQGHITIPKTISEERMISNLMVTGWTLDDEDILEIQNLNKNIRFLKYDFYYDLLGITYEQFWGEKEYN